MTRLLGSLSLGRTELSAMTLWDAERLKYTRPGFDYHRKALHTNYDRFNWRSSWPTPRNLSGDGSVGYSICDDYGLYSESVCWSPWIEGFLGHGSSKFILGRVKDSGGNGVSGAIVQGFRTSDDLYIGQTTADANGYYVFSTPYAGVEHYMVAYVDGSPDRFGTTVNTLVPTNIDGT